MKSSSSILWLRAALVFILWACGTADAGAFSVTKWVMTDESTPLSCATPVARAQPYTIYDSKAALWVDWEGYVAGTNYRYDWYSPSGKLVQSFSSVRTTNSDGCTFATIDSQTLYDEGSGEWTVRFFVGSVQYVEARFTFQDPGPFTHLAYVPPNYIPGNGILVAVHGTSFNPIGYFHFFRPIAERNGMVLVAPYFRQSDWPKYQLVFATDQRADLFLQSILEKVATATGANKNRLLMYGHSGGGQFTHRYMMAYPAQVSRIVISAPGFWTFPRADWTYPHGLGPIPALPPGLQYDLDAVGRVPKKVVVGELDVERTEDLSQSPAAELQGQNRLERSAHWVNWINDRALGQPDAVPTRYEVIAGAGHEDVRSKSATVIESFLFSPPPPPQVWGSLSIEGNASAIYSRRVNLTVGCKAALGCDSVAVGPGVDASAYGRVTWSGTAGNIQTASLSYDLPPPAVAGNFLFARVRDTQGNASEFFGDFISWAPPLSITVSKSGTGTGTVTSAPTGIDCGLECVAAFTGGARVTLTAAAATGSTFAGWSGACTGTGTCTVTVDAARSVTATFTATAILNVQGLWWRSPAASESGWGMNIIHQGNILFMTWFTYDTDGSGMWLVMNEGRRTAANTYTGALLRTTGPAFSAVPFDPARVAVTTAGSGTLTFTDANNGNFAYTVGGISQTKPITRQVYASPQSSCAQGGSGSANRSYQDLWWRSPAGSESGWGVNLTHQGDILFGTWFTYGTDGKGMWLVMPALRRTTGSTFAGDVHRTTGPAFSAVPFNPSAVAAPVVGSAAFTFTDADRGTFAYTVNGVSQTKAIERQVYSTPVSVCTLASP